MSAAIYVLLSLTYCGNVAQALFLVVGVIGICASLMHLSSFIMIVIQMPKNVFIDLIKERFRKKERETRF